MRPLDRSCQARSSRGCDRACRRDTCAVSERIVDAASHVTRQVGATLNHLARRRPVGPFALAGDMFDAGPFEARPPDADPISDRLLVRKNKTETSLECVDD
jgi:hypothetical protein